MDIDHIPRKAMATHLYPDEFSGVDIVGDENYTANLRGWFGLRVLRGTALMFCPDPEVDRRLTDCYEVFLRKIFKIISPRRAVEIGTLFGATTALLAHYSDEVMTIDISYQQISSYIAHHFGVSKKITTMIVDNNEEKKEYLDSFDFDFAFIDAEHTYDGVKFDFDCVKKCGKVLFHDYGLSNHPGITKFVDELPKEDVFTYGPFAFWEKDSGHHDNLLH